MPGKTSHIQLFYPSSANVEHTYDLTKYERIVQVGNVSLEKLFINVHTLLITLLSIPDLGINLIRQHQEGGHIIPGSNSL